MFAVVEKRNPRAVHAVCATQARAEQWIKYNAPHYCAAGYFCDETLTPESFCVVETLPKSI